MKKVLIFVIATLLFVACGGNRPSEEIQKELFKGYTEKEYRKIGKVWGYSKDYIDKFIEDAYDEYYAEQAEEKTRKAKELKEKLELERIKDSIRQVRFYAYVPELKELMKEYEILFPDIVLKEFYFCTDEGLNIKTIESANWYILKPDDLESESAALGVDNDGYLVYEDLTSLIIDIASIQETYGVLNIKNEDEYYAWLARFRGQKYADRVKEVKLKK
jgi:hypothetical protein